MVVSVIRWGEMLFHPCCFSLAMVWEIRQETSNFYASDLVDS